MDKYDLMKKLVCEIGVEAVLTELVRALSEDDAIEDLKYIAKNWDVCIDDEEEF